MKLKRENIGRETGETYFEAGLATLFNMQSIEQVCILIYLIYLLSL